MSRRGIAVLLMLGALPPAERAAALADPPAPARPAAYRVIPAEPSWGTIEGTVRLARSVPVPTITIPEGSDPDLTWRERPSDLVAFDAERLTLADALVFLERVEAGKDWSEALRAERRVVTLTFRDGFYMPPVQWTRTGTGVATVNEHGKSQACPKGFLMPWTAASERSSLQFNLMLSPGSRVEPSEDTVLSRAGRLAVENDACFMWALAHIGVFEHPYVAGPTSLDGVFQLTDVPPGTYDLVAWHGPVTLWQPDPKMPKVYRFGPSLVTRRRVTLEPAGALRVDFKLEP